MYACRVKNTHNPSYTHILPLNFTPKKVQLQDKAYVFMYRIVIKVLTQKANTALHIPLVNTNT